MVRLRQWFPWVLYGVLVLVLCMFFHHGDLTLNSFVANQVALGHLNVYAYFSRTGSLQRLATPMGPLYYLTVGAWLAILRAAHLDPVASSPSRMWFLFHAASAPAVEVGLLLLKVPNVASVVVGAWLAGELAERLGASRALGTVVWVTQSAVLMSALVHAQMDIMPTVLTLGALLAVAKGRDMWAAVLLGLGGALKLYPMLLLLPLALLAARGRPGRFLVLLLTGVVAFAVPLLPFLGRPMFSRLFGPGNQGALLGGSLAIGGMALDLWLGGFAVACYLAWTLGADGGERIVRKLAGVWLVALVPVFLFTLWLPQWAAWIAPAALVFAVEDAQFMAVWSLQSLFLLLRELVVFANNLDAALVTPPFAASGGALHKTYEAVLGKASNIPTDLTTLASIGFLVVLIDAWRLLRGRGRGTTPRMAALCGLSPLAVCLVGIAVQLHFPLQ